jgi:hypothetical protein
MTQNFDEYVQQHSIKPDELDAAFGAWLHKMAGWDGSIEEVEP